MEVEKKVAIWRLFLLSASAGAVDMGYAVEGAYVVPLMVASGLSLTLSTILISLSPIMGMVFQGFIGTVSDKCTCSWGRRRPFIVLFSLTAVLGFGAAPYCFYFSNLKLHYLVIVGVVVCVFLSDFSIGALLLPTRAYLLDAVPVSQSKTGNFIFSVAIGVGAASGYGLGAVDWSIIPITGLNANVVNQTKIVYGITTVTLFITMLCTIASVKEQNPSLTSQGKQINAETDPLVGFTTERTCSPFSGNLCETLTESTIGILKFAYYMSYNMWFLWLMNALALAADFAFTFSFSTFIGLAVYDGDSSSPEDSEPYKLYTKGVRMGSLGLAIATVCCSVMSLVLDYITRWIRLKTVLLITLAAFVCALCLLTYCRELYQVYILAAMYGPFFATVTSVPYALIPIYEVNILITCFWLLNYYFFNYRNQAHFLGKNGQGDHRWLKA